MVTKNAKALALFEKLRAELRFSRTGRFYKLSRAFQDAEHEQFITDVAWKHVSKEAEDLSGLGGPELKVVRSADIGPWASSGTQVEAYGTVYLQPVLVWPGVGTLASGLAELRFAHLLILEAAVKRGRKRGQRYAFVNCDILDDPLAESPLATGLSRAELVNPFLSSSLNPNENVRIEELNMRIMNMSRVGLRRKAVEAYDVEASVSSLGLHRSIPGTMKLRLPRDAGVGTAVTISAARQSVRAGSSRVKLSTVTQWFAQCVVRLDAENGGHTLQNTFLAEMAQALDSLDGLEPSSLLLDFAALEESGYGTTSHCQGDGGAGSADDEDSWKYAAFDDPITLTKVVQPVAPAVVGAPAPASAKATPNAQAFSVAAVPVQPTIRRYEGKVLDRAGKTAAIYVEVQGDHCRLLQTNPPIFNEVRGPVGTILFEQAVTRAKALRVAFDGGRVLYSAEGAHRSGNLRLAIQKLQASMKGVKSFDDVATEKGDDVLTANDTEFPKSSSFWAIENDRDVTATDSALVCGDAGNEVFDYLDIVTNTTPHRLRWFHAKVQRKSTPAAIAAAKAANRAAAPGTPLVMPPPAPMSQVVGSLSASDLQEVVGQAIKNLAFLRRAPSDPTFKKEVDRWSGTCKLPFEAKIDRLRRGSKPGEKVSTIVQDALAQQEVAIVIPTYSKAQLVAEFAKIESGGADQHTIQLFWLLSGFTSSCLEMGVTPLIFLRH